nr:PREDICTED: zinc finger protein 830 isoform X1 [Bemisia tabaci]XP_018901697.1 PREDICTED: zinc finger protein 830 isoform X2 [Bemisia tabaci]
MSKRKISQEELRQLMKKVSTGTKRKIDSPLAKYSNDGTLTCILCNSVVRSENVWSVHINGKEHRGNIAKKKQQLAGIGSSTTDTNRGLRLNSEMVSNPLKRPLPGMPDHPPKKIKGILKNAPKPAASASLPTDFFDMNSSSSKVSVNNIPVTNGTPSANQDKMMDIDSDSVNEKGEPETLPEGFFDDPVADAKARNVEYKDPIEEELERFQREIQQEELLSTKIIEEDNEEATTQRQIEEIDEQSRIWSRMLELEIKKEKVAAHAKPKSSQNASDSSTDEEDFDEFLDWRSKKSFK